MRKLLDTKIREFTERNRMAKKLKGILNQYLPHKYSEPQYVDEITTEITKWVNNYVKEMTLEARIAGAKTVNGFICPDGNPKLAEEKAYAYIEKLEGERSLITSLLPTKEG